ncbi:MAG: right-handed parallel beta-helix repeat-containing protein [Candidatus Handelsmanbacteria bacterium]|nr:right-handed parallel beta-helix repeat-containing protein [Candidatus Handelsmanbacteria bacterium]
MSPVLYVAPHGSDTWSGTLPEPNAAGSDGPLATLEAARDRLRQTPRPEGATVYLRGGIYHRTRAFALEALDSGTAAGPVVYRAWPGERPRLLGGVLLSDFGPVQDPGTLRRLAPHARGQVLQCDLGELGLLPGLASRGFGRPTTPSHPELFFAGRRMELARWPDGDFARIKGAAAFHGEGDGHGGELGIIEEGFYFEGDRPARWQHQREVWLHGYWAWDWANTYEQLESFDPATGLVRTRPPHGIYGIKAGQRFYFLNVLEELDQPGEYYVDREQGALFFWPPAPLDCGETALSLLAEPLIHLRGASHLRFEGLGLEYGRGSGLHVEGGECVAVAGCTLRHLGNWGALIDEGRDHTVQSCDLYSLGDGGIRLSGGDRRTLEPGGHRVLNCHIHHLGEWSRCYQPGVLLSGVGHRVSHNLIHDGPHCAILLGGNEHHIEFNHIHHVCQETGDVGAVYMGRDWTERGVVVRHNLFHHTHGYGMGSMAVYLDDCASGALVYGNVFYQCTRAAFVGGGRNNRVENNVFVGCQPAVMIDGRGLDPRPVWQDMVNKTMRERLEAMLHHQPPYSLRYPDLKQLDPYLAEGTGVPPEGNLVLRNINLGGEWLVIHWHARPDWVAVQRNIVDEDPGFVDASGLDFRLREDAPALELGFRPIPLERIGLYLDEWRRGLPEENAFPVLEGPDLGSIRA